jgi:hypothetical protein
MNNSDQQNDIEQVDATGEEAKKVVLQNILEQRSQIQDEIRRSLTSSEPLNIPKVITDMRSMPSLSTELNNRLISRLTTDTDNEFLSQFTNEISSEQRRKLSPEEYAEIDSYFKYMIEKMQAMINKKNRRIDRIDGSRSAVWKYVPGRFSKWGTVRNSLGEDIQNLQVEISNAKNILDLLAVEQTGNRTVAMERNAVSRALGSEENKGNLININKSIDLAMQVPKQDSFRHHRLVGFAVRAILSGEQELSEELYTKIIHYIEHAISETKKLIEKKESSKTRLRSSGTTSKMNSFKQDAVNRRLTIDITYAKGNLEYYREMANALTEVYDNEARSRTKKRKSDLSPGIRGAINAGIASSVLDPNNVIGWGLAGMVIGDLLGEEEDDE